MSFGIYKSGQGYWVRVMTAAFCGVLIIAAAAYGWGQAGAIRLPARAWTFSINNVEGTVNAGDSVVLYHYNENAVNPEVPVEFGEATVDEITIGKGATGKMIISNFSNDDVRDNGNSAIEIRKGEEGAYTLDAAVRGSSPTPIYPVQYLQSAVAGGIMLIGAIGLYFFVGSKKNIVEFLIATDGEMKKVNWTTYREIKGSTIVVIVATFLIAGFLFGVDTLFSSFFKAIGVLEG